MDPKEISQKVATNLLDRKAVMVKIDPPFTWVSGIKSPVYCDNRKMISFPEERRVVVEAFKEVLEGKVARGEMEMPDVIGGTATAAIPWAAFLAYEMGLPMIYIRPEKKEHGAGKQVEGYLEAGQKVLIVEDEVLVLQSLVNIVSRRYPSVFFAKDAQKALEIFEKEDIDLVITDIRMPGMDGISMLKRMQSEKPNIHRLVMSAYTEADYFLQAIETPKTNKYLFNQPH